MDSETSYKRMNDDKKYQQVVPDCENQIFIDHKLQNQSNMPRNENQNLTANNQQNHIQVGEKTYLKYDDSYFPFIDKDSEGLPVIEEHIYLKLDKKQGKKFEWTLRMERQKVILSSIANLDAKIEILWENLLGATYKSTNVGGFNIYELNIFLMKKENKSCCISYNRFLTELKFFVDTENKAKNITTLIQNYARNRTYLEEIKEDILQQRIPHFPKKLLVFINPVGGDGSAKKKWNSIKFMLEYSGYEILVVLTKYKDHAMNYVRDIPAQNLLEFVGIVTVSGDGLPHEIVNGLFNRDDKDEVCSQIVLGVLPGGSGNALINSILHELNEPKTLQGATYLICKGSIKNIDLIHMQTRSNPSIYSFLSLAWAYIADVDLNSEHLRFLAGLRFDVMGTYRALFQKNYRAKLYTSTEDLNELPLIDQPISTEEHHWEEKQERDFKYFMLMNVPLITANDVNAPNARTNDGCLDLQYLSSDQGWGQLVKYVLNFQSGAHFDKKTNLPAKGHKFKYEKVKAFRLQSMNQSDLGLISIDGESYTTDVIQGRIIPSILRVFSL